MLCADNHWMLQDWHVLIHCEFDAKRSCVLYGNETIVLFLFCEMLEINLMKQFPHLAASEHVVQLVGQMTKSQKVWGSNSRPREMGKIPEWSVKTCRLKTGNA